MFDFMNLAWVFGNRGYYISSYDIDDAMDSVMIMMGILIGVGIIAWGIFYFLKKSGCRYSDARILSGAGQGLL